MALLSEHGLDSFFSSSTAAAAALSIPRFRSIGFIPAATDFMPSRTMAWARTVAVVVPSPATSEVCEATSFTICAPMFSKRSCSSISLATETPSFVIVGAPKLFSRTTLRPLGPRVTLTALASILIPATIPDGLHHQILRLSLTCYFLSKIFVCWSRDGLSLLPRP